MKITHQLLKNIRYYTDNKKCLILSAEKVVDVMRAITYSITYSRLIAHGMSPFLLLVLLNLNKFVGCPLSKPFRNFSTKNDESQILVIFF